MLLNFLGTRPLPEGFPAKSWDRNVNVESPAYLSPGPTADGNGIGAALRQAVNDRFARIPPEMIALLHRLEQPKRAA